jgi:hypothetical protein
MAASTCEAADAERVTLRQNFPSCPRNRASHTLSAVIAGLDPAMTAVQQCWQYGFARGILSWMPPNSGVPEFGTIGPLQAG